MNLVTLALLVLVTDPERAGTRQPEYTSPLGKAYVALMNGDEAKACTLFRKLVSDDSNWPAFGFIAAEVELARLKTCPNTR